jgi:CBS domain-containing protein
MTPSSYQAPSLSDKTDVSTKSQSKGSNLSQSQSTVAQVLEGKSQEVFSIRPIDTIHDVVRILKEKRIGALVITDETGAAQGILSERDIVRRMAETPGQTLPQSVGGLMTRKVQTCTPQELLITVLKRMSEGRFRHMPVVQNGRVCGMITIGDVVQYRLQELEYEALRMKQMIVG